MPDTETIGYITINCAQHPYSGEFECPFCDLNTERAFSNSLRTRITELEAQLEKASYANGRFCQDLKELRAERDAAIQRAEQNERDKESLCAGLRCYMRDALKAIEANDTADAINWLNHAIDTAIAEARKEGG